MNYWLAKSEPESYAWAQLVKDGKTAWTGVRNFQARNNLRSMKLGDLVFFYHSGTGKQIVGLAKVTKEAYADPTADEGDWSCVDFVPETELGQPVNLETIKADKGLRDLPMLKFSRISVTPVPEPQARRLLELSRKRRD